ncbi:MAG: chlorophyll a/b-binding protein [Cyanobium sp.]
MSQKQAFRYEPPERFGEGLTTSRPWNLAALQGVERLNGRVAMLGFLAAVLGEWLSGRGIVGQLALLLRWLLG